MKRNSIVAASLLAVCAAVLISAPFVARTLAQTVSASASVSYQNGTDQSSNGKTVQSVASTANRLSATVTNTTVWAAISFGQVGSPGMSYFSNLSTNKYIQLSYDGTNAFAQIESNSLAVFQPVTTQLFTKGEASGTLLNYAINPK
jgi:phosphoribosyl-AMP cyclohydrolase